MPDLGLSPIIVIIVMRFSWLLLISISSMVLSKVLLESLLVKSLKDEVLMFLNLVSGLIAHWGTRLLGLCSQEEMCCNITFYVNVSKAETSRTDFL